MSKTERNLEEAFTGESRAYQKYLIYAQRVAGNYQDGVYKLFMALAASEVEKGHHRLLGKVLVDQEKFLVQDCSVCSACGHVFTREPPEYCQVCGAVSRGGCCREDMGIFYEEEEGWKLMMAGFI